MKRPVLPPSPHSYLTAKEVAAQFRISLKTLRRWVERGILPPPLRLSARCLRWSAHQIKEALKKRQSRCT